MNLRNDKMIIFGGGSGIGKAIAVRMIKAGATVTVIGRTEEKLRNVAREIGSERLFYKVFDITDIAHHEELFSEHYLPL